MSPFFKRRRRPDTGRGDEPPERSWVRRGDKVIGRGTLDDLVDCRQVDTYRAVLEVLQTHDVDVAADLGCNVSALGRLLRHWGWRGRYIGVENNGHALPFAARELRSLPEWRENRLVNANIRALPFADDAIECVVMKDVLEHMEDFRPCLAEAARVARRLLVIANFIPWGEGEPVIRRDPQGFYLNYYRRADVYEFATACGWQPTSVTGTLEKDDRPNEVIVFERIPTS